MSNCGSSVPRLSQSEAKRVKHQRHQAENVKSAMADDVLQRKGRSASICAPGFSSMEQMLGAIPPSGVKESHGGNSGNAYSGGSGNGSGGGGGGTPENSTPTRKRRPAARSQSARVSGGNKSIRRRAAAQGMVV